MPTRKPLPLAAYLDAGLSIEDALPTLLRLFAESISIDGLDKNEQREEFESQWVDFSYERTFDEGPMTEDRWELATMRRWQADCYHDPILRVRALDALPPALAAEVLDLAERAARPYLATTMLEVDARGFSPTCMTCGHAFEEDERVVVLASRCVDLESVTVCGTCITGLAERFQRTP